ncbi:hypothetical protein IV203_005056 [Nitzschia inconspicua]|uniref:NAD dependent epimerase/dehydratase n=1 Tax=Nitzschia inconspicua TaxID=303405 RepID=A0A9K3PIB9_9STRA|nr:hypothetical protein IV203_005056 [Nitzschia inconspicua]
MTSSVRVVGVLRIFGILIWCSTYTKSELQVLVAGLGRTGTRSLHEALEVLGYKAYHFIDFAHAQHWYKVTTGEATVHSLIDRIVEEEGYTAMMDNPTVDIYTDILKKYPTVKVILSVRDTPQQFAKSWKVLYETVEVTERDFSLGFPSFFQWIPAFWYLKRIRCFMGTTHLGLPQCHLLKQWSEYPDGWIEEQYERHNQHVMDTVPEDQLLVFNVEQGWSPLCQFLDKPVPTNKPFPHVKLNTSGGLHELKQTSIIVVWLWIPILLVIIVAVSWAFCWRSKHIPQHEKED